LFVEKLLSCELYAVHEESFILSSGADILLTNKKCIFKLVDCLSLNHEMFCNGI